MISKDALFIPEEYGLHPDYAYVLFATSGLDAHSGTYEIIDNELRIKELSIQLKSEFYYNEGKPWSAKPSGMPVLLNGVKPICVDNDFNYKYKNVNMKLTFTGVFYLCCGRMPDETGYLHQHPQFSQYVNVMCVTSRDGEIVSIDDASEMVRLESFTPHWTL